MMLFIFILLFVSTVLAWMGFRQKAIFCFAITLIFAAIYFLLDMTTPLNLRF